MDVPEDARRYSPPRLAEAFPRRSTAIQMRKRICTSHVERQNLTMRMCHAEANAVTDKRVLQEMGKSPGGPSASLRLVQLLPEAHYVARRDSCDGGRIDRSCMVNLGII